MSKYVTEAKFDAIMAKNIVLNKCPVCGNFGGEIIIPMTEHSIKSGMVFVKCGYCDYSTKARNATTTLYDTDKNRIGCPITDKSLIGAIKQAVHDWNRRTEDEQR